MKFRTFQQLISIGSNNERNYEPIIVNIDSIERVTTEPNKESLIWFKNGGKSEIRESYEEICKILETPSLR